MLELDNVCAGYGRATIIDGLSLSVETGGRLALLGRNGVGKSTLIRTIMGLTTLHSGQVRWKGNDITRADTARRTTLGLGWVPQERRIFRNLTVEENLTVGSVPGEWSLGRVYEFLPRLKERRRNLGWQLSGGEQQLLAIGRALMLNPSLLLLDEPLEGLAPVMAELVLQTLHDIADTSGIGFVIVEQHAMDALRMSADAVVMERGRIVTHEPAAVLMADQGRLDMLTGVGLSGT